MHRSAIDGTDGVPTSVMTAHATVATAHRMRTTEARPRTRRIRPETARIDQAAASAAPTAEMDQWRPSQSGRRPPAFATDRTMNGMDPIVASTRIKTAVLVRIWSTVERGKDTLIAADGAGMSGRYVRSEERRVGKWGRTQ